MILNNFVIIPRMVEQTLYMVEQTLYRSPRENRVVNYYVELNEGYLNDLGGVCHFGYHKDSDGPYDLTTAQHKMERLMGTTLGLPVGSKVLDAGCGFGPVARTLTTEFGLNVVGIDLMEELRLQKAKKLNRDAKLNTIQLCNADYHKLPFPDSSFDGVVTMETLVHANPLEDVLAEFKRVLKPGGRLVSFEYSIPPLDSLNPLAKLMAQKVINNTGMHSLHRFTHNAFPNIFIQAGFNNLYVKDISPYVWSSWRYLFGVSWRNTARDIFRGTFKHLNGCTMIYPARRNLGYQVILNEKPNLDN